MPTDSSGWRDELSVDAEFIIDIQPDNNSENPVVIGKVHTRSTNKNGTLITDPKYVLGAFFIVVAITGLFNKVAETTSITVTSYVLGVYGIVMQLCATHPLQEEAAVTSINRGEACSARFFNYQLFLDGQF